MKKILIPIAIVSVCVLAIISVLLTNPTYPAETQPVVSPKTVTVEVTPPPAPAASEIVSLVNDERKRRGIAPLAVDQRLNESAKLKAEDLYTNKYFNHVNPATGKSGTEYVFETTNYALCTHAGENLAIRFTTAKQAVMFWMFSPSHKENILRADVELTGVSILKNYDTPDTYIAVQHFCDVE